MDCLWCDQEIIPEISWENIFLLSKPKRLCMFCEDELVLLKGNRCQRCSRMIDGTICSDCAWWDGFTSGKDPLTFNYSVFAYNEQMQKMIAKWKYRGDIILAQAFKTLFMDTFRNTFSFLSKDVLIVPIPLSDDRLMERGFNQAQVLADFLPFKKEECMTRIQNEKQSKKTRYERISSRNPFIISGNINKPVILVDDIYTTGTTLRHAGMRLKEHGCPNVYSYTLIRG